MEQCSVIANAMVASAFLAESFFLTINDSFFGGGSIIRLCLLSVILSCHVFFYITKFGIEISLTIQTYLQ